METAKLGTSGVEISRLGIGGWQASGSGPWGYGPTSDDDDSIAAIRRAVELGVTWVDTAASYGLGHSEDVVRRALAPWRIGEDVLVFTKCGHPWEPPDRIRTDLRPEFIRRVCEGSLQRLGVERLDLLQFHHPDPTTPIEDSWGTIAELRAEGKVRLAGVSNFDVSLLDRCERIAHVDVSQPELNLLRAGALDDEIPWCLANGTGVIVYSPMATGILAGGYDRERLLGLPDDDWRHKHAGRIVSLVERSRLVAERLGVPVGALAVAWTLAADGVTGAICGARNPLQVETWAGASAVRMDPETIAELTSLARTWKG